MITALIKPVGLLFDRVMGWSGRVKAKFYPPTPKVAAPTSDEFKQVLGEIAQGSDAEYRKTAQADFEAAQKHLKEQFKKDPVSGKVAGNEVSDEELAGIFQEINHDLETVGFNSELRYDDDPVSKQEQDSVRRFGDQPPFKEDPLEDLAAQVEGVYHELDAVSGDVDELRQIWKKCSELLNSIMEEMGKKQYKLSGDDKFLADAEMSNQINRIASHTAKKTVELGLTQALPEMVRQSVASLAEDELQRIRGDVRAFLKLELHNAVKEIIDDVNEIDGELDGYEEDICQLQEGSEKAETLVLELEARINQLEGKGRAMKLPMAKLAKAKKPARK